jgi:carboxynorspermidine decarboxylase
MMVATQFDDDGKRQSLMDWRRVSGLVETPAFVLDEGEILRALRGVAGVREACGCKVLYALKPLCQVDCLRWMAPRLDGFATSSLFEARLAREVVAEGGTVHITTPGFRPDEMAEVGRLCDHVAFNSLTQLRRFRDALPPCGGLGLRVNPQLPLVDDDRYNPCRRHSKLGVPLDQLRRELKRGRGILEGINGLHFHTNCDSDRFAPLLETVRHLDDRLSGWLGSLEWVNLGGGYLFGGPGGLDGLVEAVGLLRSRYGLEVFLEPGAGLVRGAGYLVASVIDLFKSDGRTIAVLDTTVNHMPEVFEYQFEPDVLGDSEEGGHEYLLAGGTCLAGDLFGLYGFDEPLEIGSRVVFPDVGAYTTVKAHLFNGINLPSVYTLGADGRLELRRRYTYQDFVSRCGVDTNAAVRA